MAEITLRCVAFNIELARKEPHINSQYSASNVTNISLDSRKNIFTVKYEFSPYSTANEGSLFISNIAYNPRQSSNKVSCEGFHLS